VRVGSDIEAICKKCGDVWHVVIALAARRIAKVECKECGARHGYRGVKGEIGAVRGKPAARATSSRTRSGKKKQPVRADERAQLASIERLTRRKIQKLETPTALEATRGNQPAAHPDRERRPHARRRSGNGASSRRSGRGRGRRPDSVAVAARPV